MFITIHTKEQGRLDLNKEEYYNFNYKTVTFHRTDGPASIYYHPNRNVRCEYYYIDDENYKKEDYDNLINEMKALPKSLKLIHKDWWVRDL